LNNPEYILTDEFGIKDANGELTGGVLFKVKQALNLTVLNYQYGDVEELNQTLIQYNQTPDFAAKKFPLVWLMQPFTILRGEKGFYGSVDGLKIFIINSSVQAWKAPERMANNFKPVIYPIYRELMKQLDRHKAFESSYHRKHKFTDRYYWGEAQQSVLNDVVDCSEISNIELKIKDNPNCLI
jgi:hypothetical protein